MRRLFAAIGRAALPAAAALAAAPCLAQEAEPQPPTDPEAVFMTGEELTEAFSGAEYQGCYVDGTIWAERTAEDGALYDTRRLSDLLVGSWWVENGAICYAYPAEGTTACWRVIRDDGEFYFYVAGTLQFLASTDCGDPIA